MNEVEGDAALPGWYDRQEIAAEAGRAHAMRRQAEHLIHNKDGTIAQHASYGGNPVYDQRAVLAVRRAALEREMAQLERDPGERNAASNSGSLGLTGRQVTIPRNSAYASEGLSAGYAPASRRASTRSVLVSLWVAAQVVVDWCDFRAVGKEFRTAGLQLARLANDDAVRSWGSRLAPWLALGGACVALGVTIARLG